MRSRHLSVVIYAERDAVYAFIAGPKPCPSRRRDWRRRRCGAMAATSSWTLAMGEVRVRFVPKHAQRVADHDVRLPDGTVVTNPLRLLTHPHGSEVVFTVRQLAMSDADFARDYASVEQDLVRLKAIVEG